MSLHPILALDHVIAEYRDYLHSEFRAKDPGLRKSLEAELDKPLFLAQEPFFQAHRPFRKGKRWRDLPLDAKLARVMEERSKDERACRRRGFRSQESGFRNSWGQSPKLNLGTVPETQYSAPAEAPPAAHW